MADATNTAATDLTLLLWRVPMTVQFPKRPPGGNVSSGSYISTRSSNYVAEVLTGQSYAEGKRSHLEHRWTFNVTGGSTVDFLAEAWHNSPLEDFVFEYLLDGANWNSVFTVSKNADHAAARSFQLPAGASGQVHVRVVDTDQSRGEASADSISIDDMFIHSQS